MERLRFTPQPHLQPFRGGDTAPNFSPLGRSRGGAVLLLVLLAALFLSGCWPEDERYVLPTAAPVDTAAFAPKYATVVMGELYDTRIYYNLATGTQTAVRNDMYDLALETSPEGFRIWLNEGKLMMGYSTGLYRFDSVYVAPSTSHSRWQIDDTGWDADSTIIGSWPSLTNAQGHSPVYILNRGSLYHSGAGQQFYKLQIISVSETEYTLRFAPVGLTEMPTSVTVPKGPVGYSRVYFSFANGGQVVQVAPPDTDWHLLFTRYTAILDNAGTPLAYSVTGVIANRPAGVRVAQVAQHPERSDTEWDSLNSNWLSANPVVFPQDADVIGHTWKLYDFDDGYITHTGWHFLLSAPSPSPSQDNYYKLRFLDFYDTQGIKGAPTFQHQLIKN